MNSIETGQAEGLPVPHLARILLYPIKSMQPLDVARGRLLRSGAMEHDRLLALFDHEGNVVNGKRTPIVHTLRMTFDPTLRRVSLFARGRIRKQTFSLDDERVQLQDTLSETFGFPVVVKEDTAAGFPDDTESPGPTLISTASLRAVGAWFGISLEQARLRFRTNLEIDGVEPFWEDRLYGPPGTTVRFQIGDVVFDGINPCQRCVVPTRDPLTGEAMVDFARRFVELRRQYLPEWVEPSRFNHFYRLAINTRLVRLPGGNALHIGDLLTVLGPQGKPETIHQTSSTPWNGKLQIKQIIDETPTVKTFRLAAVDGGPLPFRFRAGQYLTILPRIADKMHRRTYTIASSPTQERHLDLTIKLNPTGTVSKHLHRSVGVGEMMDATGPGGRFTFDECHADALVLIAAGVGITPLISKLRELIVRQWRGRIDLIYSVRSIDDIIYRRELTAIAAEHPNVKVTLAVTRSVDDSPTPPRWRLHRGRIDRAVLCNSFRPDPRCHIHICGPTEFTADIRSMLNQLNVDPETIRAESFGGTAITHAATGAVRTVTFHDGNKSAAITSSDTILKAAHDAGVTIDHGCLAGACGRCKVRLIAGDVTMECTDALTEEDADSGLILACQSRPDGDVVLETL